MTKIQEELVFDTPKAIARLYGCPTELFPIEKTQEFLKAGKKTAKFMGNVKENVKESCRVCGRVESIGYSDPQRLLIQKSTNNLYSWSDAQSDFHCAYCFYNYKNYAKKLQGKGSVGSAKVVGDMANVIVHPEKLEFGDFLSSSKENRLYKLFTSPIKAPYVVMLKRFAGTSIVDMAHTAKPTIDSELIVVNYGVETFYCPRKRTLECIRDGNNLIKNFNNKDHKVSEDIPFNRQTSEGYNSYLTMKLRNDAEFMSAYSQFVTKYDKGVRFVSKIMLNSYREEQKQKQKKEK